MCHLSLLLPLNLNPKPSTLNPFRSKFVRRRVYASFTQESHHRAVAGLTESAQAGVGSYNDQ